MLNKLWFKFTLSFLLVAVVVVAVVAILANRATKAGFRRFLDQDGATEMALVQVELADYYVRHDGWQGAETVLDAYRPGRGQGTGGTALVLLDDSGQVVAAVGAGRGRQAMITSVDDGFPIRADGEIVGTLIVDQPGMMGNRAGQLFLDSVNRAIILAGLAAVGLALLLGAVLARGLTRPLGQLTRATRAMAGGDLDQQVKVQSSDELGELADSFNQMAAALSMTEKQRQQLFADIAHELRTPLSVVRGQLESMLDGVFELSLENVSVAHEETLLLSQLVDELRTLSLAESGQLVLNRRPLDLAVSVRQAEVAFEPLAEAEGVRLKVTISDDLPLVSADPARIQQLLGNLLSNALRHASQQNDRPPEVRLKVSSTAGSVQVSVSDNGPGLSMEAKQHVFDRFWRADIARSRDRGGSGLGLAICKGIVSAHGGEIWVDSTLGEGAVFAFELPVDSTSIG